MKDAFQLENTSLVQSNGHYFENSNTTKELLFWKSPARKVHAIPNIPAPEAGSTELTINRWEKLTNISELFP